VTDATAGEAPTSYEVQLKANDGIFSDTVLFDQTPPVVEPPGVWDGLALPYTINVFLSHNAAGNILAAAPLTGSTSSPANVYQVLLQGGATNSTETAIQ
jgi:hypothetical protein